MKKRICALALVLITLCLALTGCVKVVPLNSGASGTNTGDTKGTDENFDAAAFISKNFGSKFVPELEKNAVDFTALMKESGGKLDTVGKKYGHRATADSSYNYVVKGTAKVDEIKTELRAGYVTLKFDGYTGSEPVQLQVGPVFKGTALRDSIPSIKFDDFRNQVTYAAISTELHKYVTQKVLPGSKPADWKGKAIEFEGAFADDGSGTIVITPFELKVK